MPDKKLLLWAFLPLVAIATLFPPCLYGEHGIANEIARVRSMPEFQRIQYFRMHPAPSVPVKGYSFLFWPSSDRRVLIPDLFLEYVLALILAVFLSLCVIK